MPFLPSYRNIPKTALEKFIYNYEPAGRKDARDFRQDLIEVLNAEQGGAKTNPWTEHPDSMYLEDGFADRDEILS